MRMRHGSLQIYDRRAEPSIVSQKSASHSDGPYSYRARARSEHAPLRTIRDLAGRGDERAVWDPHHSMRLRSLSSVDEAEVSIVNGR